MFCEHRNEFWVVSYFWRYYQPDNSKWMEYFTRKTGRWNGKREKEMRRTKRSRPIYVFRCVYRCLCVCAILFLCNVIKMIKIVCSSHYFIMIYLRKDLQYLCVSIRAHIHIHTNGETFRSHARWCACVHGTVAVELSKRAMYSQMLEEKWAPSSVFVALYFLFLWLLWTSIFFIFVRRWRVFRTFSRSATFSVTNTKIEWNHPPNGVSFFSSSSLSRSLSRQCFRQVLSESCYYYNEFWH